MEVIIFYTNEPVIEPDGKQDKKSRDVIGVCYSSKFEEALKTLRGFYGEEIKIKHFRKDI